jgi:phospholipid/cholesterol/gamma-HCH transport system permease protein
VAKRDVAVQESDRSAVLRPTEGIDRSHARSFWAQANRLFKERSPSRLVLDLHEVKRIDGAGVALVRQLEDRCRQGGIEFSIEGAAPGVSRFLDFVRQRSPEGKPPPPPRTPSRTAALSRELERWGHGAKEFVEYIGRFAERAAFLATHPHRVRLGDVLYHVQKAGAEGMWLLIGLSLLLGVIMAFQGLTGARGFGSPILVADVVTLSTTREMAPLLTGVIVTGRSGAAIAAEIGSMKIHEELDALSVMGFDVMRFLFVPRTLALIISTPLLTLLSIGAGILGGAGVAVFDLHLTAAAYFNEVQHAIAGTQIASALVKGATFGLMIGLIACFQGLRAGKAAEDVGRQTTTAVVRSILAIIFADAFFSILTQVYGW